jgi:predicted aldo/keto reductase-like oxidoreductase
MATTDVAIPTRLLGKTGRHVTIFGLGGEGVLRTWGEDRAAAKVISRALDQGVNYCDTAPAYAGSLDYYGATLGERRKQIFLASKTHERSRDRSLKLLDESLRRAGTDHFDLWQLHDLRTMDDLDQIFAKGGALDAMIQAKSEGRVKHLGVTGHHDPAILLEAMRRFAFDTVLVALNAADVHRLPFISTVVAEAVKQNMGIIAMKVCAQKRVLARMSMAEALGYVWSIPGVSLAIVGCETPAEVDENADIARAFQAMTAEGMRELEGRTRRDALALGYFKRGAY